jgi:hypothetical protein
LLPQSRPQCGCSQHKSPVFFCKLHPAKAQPLLHITSTGCAPPVPQVNFMAPFNSASFPDSLAIAKEDSLTLGTIDAIQKLHIRAVPLGEQPRRLALQDATRTLAVATAGLLGGMGEARCQAGSGRLLWLRG